MLVERGQQREPDAGAPGGRCNGEVRIRLALPAEPVQVEELGDLRVTAAQQLEIAAGTDRLEIIALQPAGERVHGVAPAPEIIALARGALRPGSEDALEGVAMRVDDSGQRKPADVGRARRARR